MTETEHKTQEPTAVDDVRHVREKIAAQHGGNMREHMEETNRIFEQMRTRLNLKVASAGQRPACRTERGSPA